MTEKTLLRIFQLRPSNELLGTCLSLKQKREILCKAHRKSVSNLQSFLCFSKRSCEAFPIHSPYSNLKRFTMTLLDRMIPSFSARQKSWAALTLALEWESGLDFFFFPSLLDSFCFSTFTPNCLYHSKQDTDSSCWIQVSLALCIFFRIKFFLFVHPKTSSDL